MTYTHVRVKITEKDDELYCQRQCTCANSISYTTKKANRKQFI